MSRMNRRQFLQDSVLFSSALAALGTGRSLVSAAEKAAKAGDSADQLRVAVVGVKGRGRSHLAGFAGKNNCVVSVICDCDTDEKIVGPASAMVEKAQGKAPKFVQDIRKVLEDKTIDIVSIATPNHWHALAAIWAMQAGKDVYVEKPVSHNVWEGHMIVEAARKLNKICQTGTQSRSMTGMRDAIAFLQAGKLGKVSLARGLCYKRRNSIGKVTGEQPVPKTIDYDLWCGPAAKLPLMRKNLHYDWHWVWNTGNGDLGNQGIHEMDKARWGLGKSELPRSVVSVGGRFGYVDDGETANTQICAFDYGDAELIFEVRGLESDSPYPHQDKLGAAKRGANFVGNVWYGTEGVLVCPSYNSGVAFTNQGEIIAKFQGGSEDAHFTNFVQAVRARKKDLLHADILEGHLSSAMCHLGNISYRLGKETPFTSQSGTFGGDKAAMETFARMTEHLKENKLPLDETKYHLGRKLTLDAKTETFVGDQEADKMLTREYRKGFEVPAKI